MSKVPQSIRRLFAIFPLYTYPPLPIGDGDVNKNKPFELYVYNLKDGWPTDPEGLKAYLLLRYLKLDCDVNSSSHYVSSEGTLPYLVENATKKTIVYKTVQDIEENLVNWQPEQEIYRHMVNATLEDAFVAYALINPSVAGRIYEFHGDQLLPLIVQQATWAHWSEIARRSLSLRYPRVNDWDKNSTAKQEDLDMILERAIECFKGIEALLKQRNGSEFLGGSTLNALDIIVCSYIRSILVWLSHSELGLSVPESLIRHSTRCEEILMSDS